MLAEDPFQVLDEGGVGSMIISSVQRAQRSGADVKVMEGKGNNSY